MSKTISLSSAGFAIISSVAGEQSFNDHSSPSFVVPPSTQRGDRCALIKFTDSISGEDRYREITGGLITISGNYSSSSDTGTLSWGALDKFFDPQTVTYTSYGYLPTFFKIFPGFTGSATKTDDIDAVFAKSILTNGAAIGGDAGLGQLVVYTNPSVSIYLGDIVHSKFDKSKIYVNGYSVKSYTVTLDRTAYGAFSFEPYVSVSSTKYLELPPIQTTKFRYRAPGAGSYTEVDLNGSTEYSMPGNLMPVGEMEFQFAMTDATGYTTSSDWYTVKTRNLPFISSSPNGNSFVNRYSPALFSYTAATGVVVSAMRYRKVDGAYTEVAVNDAQKGYTMPAGTITDGANYEYCWVATDQFGAQWVSDWYTFNTIDATSTAEAASPVSALIDGDDDNIFTWRHIISTGSAQTKAELQKKTEDGGWQSLKTVTGPETSTIIPGNSFTSGSWYWRVRTYNADSVAGEWSPEVQIIVVSTPTAPVITVVDNSPKPSITWQTSEQQAAEVTVDGSPTKIYGSGKAWTSPVYLADGEHTITVRAQNSYGRWSKPGAIALTVVNTPGPDITLQVSGRHLSWTPGDYDYFTVYRNLVLIDTTDYTDYIDDGANGEASYQVRGCYDDSNFYGLSNIVSSTINLKYYRFRDLESGEALDVQHCGLRNQTVTHNNRRDVSLVHVPGYQYPIAERSEYRDVSVQGAAVFFTKTDAQQFEAFSGRFVCIMAPGGNNYTGYLSSVEVTSIGQRRWDCTFSLTLADGQASYPGTGTPDFYLDFETGELMMGSSDSYDGPEFTINTFGSLEVDYDGA